MARKTHKANLPNAPESENVTSEYETPVHSQWAKIRREIGDNTKDLNHDAEQAEILGLITKIASEKNVSVSERLHLLELIQETAFREAENIRPRIPEKAPILWELREDQNENPFAFAHRIYGEVAKFMVISDFQKIDNKLGNALNNHKNRGKFIPNEFYIQSKQERDKELIESAPATWAELVDSLPPFVRRKLRAFNAARVKRTHQN